MDYEKIKALTIAETEARTQEILAAERLRVASEAIKVAQIAWTEADARYRAAKTTRENYVNEAVLSAAKVEVAEYLECP